MLKYCMAGKLVAFSPCLADLNHGFEKFKAVIYISRSLGTRLVNYLVTLN